jgi:hypothetical protein
MSSSTRVLADQLALVGFAVGALSVLALLVAYGVAIQRWVPGFEGLGVGLYLATYPCAFVGTLLSGRGRCSHTRHGLATAGFVLCLVAILVTVGYFVLAMIVLSNSHFE